MITCPACSISVSESSASCPSCHEPLDDRLDATKILSSDKAIPSGKERQSSTTSISHETLDGSRFHAGQVLASRYRVIDMIGRGGMGEVYRAEDLTLKQTVALKFLPESLVNDAPALERIRNEVSIARQIAHPYVCRVYDIGEAEGQHFLCMEFIKGEELASVLKRFGRLPSDKASDIARQICAGLAAAHKQGVIHRDLKPANVMIDGEGNAKITDFGLAAVAEQLTSDEIRSGTPAYMSPEQLAGEPLTTRSDIYSLGLVLYEIFTGKPAFKADSLPAMLHLRNSGGTVTSPAGHVSGLDPLVERVIMRCVEKEPQARPESAIAVAAALPGGDPLAAALAMGETPSPEMVASSGENIGLRPWIAATLLGWIIAGLVAAAVLGGISDWKVRAVRDNSPQDLAVKSRDIVTKLGYTDPPADSAFGFSPRNLDARQVRYITENSAPGTDLWNSVVSGRPGPVEFWYRQSLLYMEPVVTFSFGSVTEWDPPRNAVTGMVSIGLEPNGGLRYFHAIPREKYIVRTADAPTADWALLFSLAGLDLSKFTPADPIWTPTMHADEQASWTGSYPGQPDQPIRVSAASYAGKPVSFFIDQPWDPPPFAWSPPAGETADLAGFVILALLFMALIILAIWLARINIRLGRGDRLGAARLAFLVFALTLASWVFGGDHNATPDAFLALIQVAIAQSLLAGALVWLIYMALEPHVRRRWPETIISWTRAVGGDVRNALVGRDALVGVAVGVLSLLLASSEQAIRLYTGSIPTLAPHLFLLDTRRFIASGILNPIKAAVIISLFFFLLVCLIRLVTRRRWLAGGVYVLVFTLLAALVLTDLPLALPFVIVSYTLTAALMLRFGLLPMVVCSFVTYMLGFAHISTDFSAWYSGSMIAAVGIVLGLAVWAFHTSLGGEKLFREGLLNE